MEHLPDFISCCRSLTAYKVTERRKQVDKFRQLLGKTYILKALDANSDTKQTTKGKTNCFAWDNVFKVTVDLLWFETDLLRKAKESISATAISNREKKKQEVSGLVKFVVKLTDKRGERLKCSSVVTHIIEVMHDSFTCSAYGLDYSSLLLKNIMCVRKYVTELTPKMWHDLIHIYTKLYKSPPAGFNRVILGRLIHTFVVGSCRQCDVRPRRLIAFFAEMFRNIRQEKSTVVVEHLLAAMNVIIQSAAANGRKQICRLGEDVFLSLLYLWDNRPTDILKEEIIQFFHIQLLAHHPHGARTEETGAFAVDWELWKSHMRKLYEAVYTDLSQLGGRNKFSTGFREAVLKSLYVELVSNLCHQLFTGSNDVIEVTQMQTESQISEPRAKKRRLESGWSALRDAISSTGQTMQAIPWLQLLKRLLEKYPASLPADEVNPFLEVLLQILTESKRGEVVSYTLLCLRSIAQAFRVICGTVQLHHSQTLWDKVWAAGLRLISLHQSTKESFQLLTSLTKCKLTTPTKDMWNLFFPNICTPSQEAVEFIAAYLPLHDLPDNYQPSLLGVSHLVNRGSYPLRKLLCDWLLLGREDLNDLSVKEYCKINQERLAEIVSVLTLRNCRSGFQQLSSSTEETRVNVDSSFDERMQDLYLSSTFDMSSVSGIDSRPRSTDVVNNANVLQVFQHIQELFQKDVKALLEIPEPQVSVLECMAHRCCLCVKLIHKLTELNVVTVETVLQLNLVDSLKVLLKKFSSILVELLKKEGIAQFHSIFSAMEEMMTFHDGCSLSVSYMMTELLRHISPAKLLDCLMIQACEQSSSTRSKVHIEQPSTSRGGLRKNTSGVFDDFDLGFDDPPSDKEDVDELDFNMDINSPEVEDSSDQSKVCGASLLSVDSLTETQLARVKAVRLLVKWSSYDRCPENTVILSELKAETVKQKILELLDDQSFDASRAVDLHILREVVFGLTINHHRIVEEDLQKILDAIGQVAKCHRRDQQVCAMILDLLTAIVPYLADNDDMTSVVKHECRDITLHLLSAYWKLQENGQTVCQVRLSITKCLETFIKNDPAGEWAVLRRSPSDAGDNVEVKIWEEFLVSLSDTSFVVRKYTAEALTCLFGSGQVTVQQSSATRQTDLFNKMYEVIQDALSLEGKLTPDEQEDECMGRTSSLLLAVSVVARHSPLCEKMAVFTCCQLIKEKNISIHLVSKGLYQVASRLGYQDVKTYLTTHLPYLIDQWLHLKYDITEFPSQLMGYLSASPFYREHYREIIPYLVMHKNMAAVQQICQEMKADWLNLLQECIPQTVVHILPLFATGSEDQEKETSARKRQLAHASACYDLLIQAVTQQVVEKCIVSNLDELVVNILMALHDPQEWDLGDASSRDQDPEPNPPYFNTDVITATLNYLTQSFSGNTKSLVSVLAKTQDAIQNILLLLAIHVSRARRCHEKRRILLMYRLFVKLLMMEFHDRLGGSWAFVLREVIYRAIYIFVQTSQHSHSRTSACPWEVKYQRSIISLCLDVLYNVCQMAMDNCHEELGKYLSWIVSHLLGYVNMEGEVGSQVLQLVKYLCVENASTMRTYIAGLDQFPDDPVFKDMRHIHKKLKYASGPFTVEQEIEHFLQAGQQQESASENRKEGLCFLQQQLSERAEEMKDMVSNLADMPDESPLCKLVSELVHLSRSSSETVRCAASQCLGEIGPVNLGLVSLSMQRYSPSLTEALTAYSDSPDMKKYCMIFHLLNDYLTDQCVEIVESASNVLKAMLYTKAGQTFCADYKTRLDDRDFLFQYLHPFRASKKMVDKVKVSIQNDEGSVTSLNDEAVWFPAHTDHNLWVTGLVTSLLSSGAIQDELLSLLAPVCKVKTKFCEVLLPYLVHDILLNGSDKEREALSAQISSFFSLHCNLYASSQGGSRSTTPYLLNNIDQESICMNKESVRVMLSVVQYLRQQERPRDSRRVPTPFDKNLWLDIDYLHVAKAAQNCSAYFTTLLYIEIWCDVQSKVSKSDGRRGGKRHSVSQGYSQDWSQTSLGHLSTTSSSSGISVQEMMLEAYVSIGDPDGLYGCGAGRFADNMSRIKTYEHENKWDEALVAYTVEMNHPVLATQSGFLQALQNCGGYHLLETYINCAGRETLTSDPDHEELRYEAAWRLGNWSLDVPNSLEAGSGYHQSLYCALEALKEKQPARVISSFCDLARQVSLKLLNEASLESTRSLYPILGKLHSLNKIDDLLLSDKRDDVSAVLDKWGRVQFDDHEFEFLEPTLTVQCRLLQILVSRGHREGGVYVGVIQQLEKLVRMSRQAGRYELAGHVIQQLKELQTPEIELHLSWQIEEACLYWARTEHSTGKHLMKTLINKLDKMKGGNPEASRVFPHVLMMYGNWLADTRSDSPNVIMENYLVKAVEWLESHGDEGGFALDAYLSLARYADAQYQNIVNYMKSSTFESKQNLVKKAKEELERYRGLADRKDRYLRTLEKQSEIDEAELAGLHEDRTSFLLRALESYIKCLKCGDKHDLRIFRVVSLWFDNASLSDVNEFILDAVDGVKTYKFLPLMYQLAARMSTTHQYHQLFKPTLDRLIERTAIEHPYQTLFIILALAHANKDTELLQQAKAGKRSKLGKSSTETLPVEEDRVLAAKAMVDKLKMGQVSKVLGDMEKLCVAYIQLANWNVEQYKKEIKALPLPTSLMIMQIKNLERVVNPTVPTKVDPSCEYQDITHIVGFQPTFKLAGGVNLPKIITCICSDGKWRRQLVKGRDDLRQDAVMQQVFEMVNALLQKDAQTRKRKLKVRTYKVVPLSQRSGLLEWCEGTQPLGEYLAGNAGAGIKGAHARYRPHDLAPFDCRKKMTAVHEDRNLDKKHKVYVETCAEFLPVFRHFFLEKYLDPAVWYDRRMAYTKSVATNSIVGYILGLGDRHVQNILIDCNTAELIHIDLGVAFEQGHILPTPETVPFRLTRDIVDGMGVAGVEGVFTRCCEKTMEVMHQNQESLLTILQVLLYDPLYTWTISPLKAYALQHHRDRQEADTADLNSTAGDLLEVEDNKSSAESQEKVNKLAERVLLRLHQKLQGIEDGVQLSLSGQVNHLIQEARDTKNLCKLFPGWQPYM